MRDMVKWVAVSLVVHLGFLALILALPAKTVRYAPPIIIDFTIGAGPAPEPPRKQPKPATAARRRPVPATPPTLAPKKPRPPQPRRTPAPQPAAAPKPTTAPAPSAPLANNVVTAPAPGQVAANPEPAADAPRAARGGRSGEGEKEGVPPHETARKEYLRAHFTGIRDLIVKRLSYPRIARRMGWSGRVVLSFVVAEDGGVHSIRINESSGYAVLDKSAMDTVRNAAPFPRPPVAAEIVIPVQFRLQ